MTIILFNKNWSKVEAIILGCTFAGLAVFSWGEWGDIAYDTGHELEIAARILEGQVLYRDVQTPYAYGPLSYYVNACLLFIFGNRIETFYFAGLCSSAMLLTLIYRLFSKWLLKPMAGLVIFVVLVHCIFEKSLSNFIFPYTYSATYAQVLAMTQLYVLVQQRPWSPLVGGGLAGLALLSKPEFGVAALGAGLIYQVGQLWNKQVDKWDWFRAGSFYGGGFVLTVGACLWPLLAQVEVQTFLNNALPFQRLAVIQRTILAQSTPLHTLEVWSKTGLFFGVVSLVILSGVYIRKYLGIVIALVSTVGLLGGIYTLGVRGQDLLPLRNLHLLFWVLPLLLWLPEVRVALGQKIEVLWIALYLYSFSVLLNMRAGLDILFYPIYGLSLILLFCLLLGTWYRHAGFYLGVCGVTATLGLLQYYTQPTYSILSPRGLIKTHDYALGQAYQSTVDFLLKIPPASRQRVLTLPDGAILNYLSATHAPGLQTFFNPLILANAQEEQQWIQNLEEPAYIVLIHPLNNPQGHLGAFNPRVNRWIRCQHEVMQTFGEPPLIEIFRGAISRPSMPCRM